MRANTSTPKSEKETLDYIDKAATQLDEQRLAGLQEVQNIQLIKDEVLQREMKRLEAKHGKDHPEAQAAKNRVMYNKEMLVGLDKEIEKASIKTEPLPNNGWRVHGRVFDQKNEPVNGVTVFLADEKMIWIRELGNVCTDKTGYYSITVDESKITLDEKPPLYLSVSDKSQKLLYQDSGPLFATKELIDYRDVYLNGKECVPPSPPLGKGNKPQSIPK